ncbi:hypothetical protein H7849_14165 [Alloacidobacterium dinghuense]|uniref:Uncharacterized protein n=1 Tax=Alloacidobacterium dinghuense TaxID=2763107 RepID=A0A7G8BCQ1_9BACT|nr:hypothetical protein [Alloacidobacterium dinghuense]QNI30321.1 hypothetical protein H7849_14165 [Alloacidobacterium dinghuense]
MLSLPPILAQDPEHPASGYLEAKLRTGVDAGHTKIGEEFQAETLSGWSIAGCTIPQGGRIYGKVVAATRHTKSSPESTLGLLIEGVDCQGSHSRSGFALHVLEIMAPDLQSVPLHSVLPTGKGGMTSVPMAHDDNIASGDETSSIRVGAVLGENNMKLEIAAGPEFADLLRSDKQTVSLLSGTRLVLGTKEMIPDDMQLHFHPPGQEP